MSCVLCTSGCEFCQPEIPGWYGKSIPPKRRTHEQLKAVQEGLHPSGNGPNKDSSPTNRCGTCRFRAKIAGSQKYVDCSKAEVKELRLQTVYTWGCYLHQAGPERKPMHFVDQKPTK